MNPAGTALIYSTYLGGTGTDYPPYLSGVIGGIAVDSSGSAYVTGSVNFLNFPTTSGAFDRVPGNVGKAFISKLDPTGSSLVYSTLLGGSGGDTGNGIALDASGNAYVAGTPAPAIFPLLQTHIKRGQVAALNMFLLDL